jgi:YjbE family integral membrane protein
MDIMGVFNEFAHAQAWISLGQVIMIDLILAGDNAIVVGALAAGLPRDQQRKVIAIGIVAALVLRIVFALLVTQLLQIIGLLLAGGLLLLWVAWKMYRELHPKPVDNTVYDNPDTPTVEGPKPTKTFAQAAWAVALADVSMSLDNVLAVAGAARDHPSIMVFGLAFAVILMGVAASYIARVIDKYRWIAYVGLLVILYVALKMVYEGGQEVWPYFVQFSQSGNGIF